MTLDEIIEVTAEPTAAEPVCSNCLGYGYRIKHNGGTISAKAADMCEIEGDKEWCGCVDIAGDAPVDSAPVAPAEPAAKPKGYLFIASSPLTDDQLAEIKRRAAAGETRTQIREALNMTKGRLRGILEKHKIATVSDKINATPEKPTEAPTQAEPKTRSDVADAPEQAKTDAPAPASQTAFEKIEEGLQDALQIARGEVVQSAQFNGSQMITIPAWSLPILESARKAIFERPGEIDLIAVVAAVCEAQGDVKLPKELPPESLLGPREAFNSISKALAKELLNVA